MVEYDGKSLLLNCCCIEDSYLVTGEDAKKFCFCVLSSLRLYDRVTEI
jgi:hypothetical protein